MTKTVALFFLFLAFAGTLYAQTIRLSTSYPEPRVGQQFTVTLDLDFIDKHLKENLPTQLEPVGYTISAHSWEIKAMQAGTFTVGPLTFAFNGKSYVTDSLSIHVLPPLPKREGLWIRLMLNGDDVYLVLEQFMEDKPSKPKKITDSNPFIPMDQPPFATLLREPLPGLEFFQRQSYSSTTSSDTDLGVSLAYSIQIFKITNHTGAPIHLTKEFLMNWPKKEKLPELDIPPAP